MNLRLKQICFALIVCFATFPDVATAQTAEPQTEIFLGNKPNAQRFPTPKPENHLAKCLADPDDQLSCYLAGSSATDAGLENHFRGEFGVTRYVPCNQPGGVCLELAVYDPNAPNSPKKSATSRYATTIDVRIQFDFDTDTVLSSEADKLRQLAAAMTHSANAKARFAIIGHTDSKGSDVYNCDLSLRRSKAVANRLRALGIAADQIHTIGAGEHLLRDAADGRAAQNRRVGFVRSSAHNAALVDKISKLCTPR